MLIHQTYQKLSEVVVNIINNKAEFQMKKKYLITEMRSLHLFHSPSPLWLRMGHKISPNESVTIRISSTYLKCVNPCLQMLRPTKSHEIWFLFNRNKHKLFFLHATSCFIDCLTINIILKNNKIIRMLNNVMYCYKESTSRRKKQDVCLQATRQRQWAADRIPNSNLNTKILFNSTTHSGGELLIDDVGFEFLRHSLGANWVIIYKHHLIIMPIH